MILMHSTEIGLVLFVASFLFIVWYALTRLGNELDQWSKLPLASLGDDPVEESELTQSERAHD
jgi:hypothetical protein